VLVLVQQPQQEQLVIIITIKHQLGLVLQLVLEPFILESIITQQQR